MDVSQVTTMLVPVGTVDRSRRWSDPPSRVFDGNYIMLRILRRQTRDLLDKYRPKLCNAIQKSRSIAVCCVMPFNAVVERRGHN